jgi:hypothetical protein
MSAWLLLAALLLSQEEASPEAEAPPTVDIGMVLAVAGPVGTLAGGVPMDRVSTSHGAVTLEVTWRASPVLRVGGYFRVTGSDARPPYAEACGWCNPVDLGVGALVRWSYLRYEALDAWVAGRVGFEDLFDEDGAAFNYWGWEVGGALGLDFHFDRVQSLGFELGTRWGQFAGSSGYFPFPQVAGRPEWHGWLDLGFRYALSF